MLEIIFIDAARVIDEQALEHDGSFPEAAALAGAGDSGKARAVGIAGPTTPPASGRGSEAWQLAA